MSYLLSSCISMESYVAHDLLINIYNIYIYLPLDSKLYEGRDCAPYSCSPLYPQCLTQSMCSMNICWLEDERKGVASESRNMGEGKKILQEYKYKKIALSHSCKAKTSSPGLNSNYSKSYPYTELSSNWGTGCNKSENQQNRLWTGLVANLPTTNSVLPTLLEIEPDSLKISTKRRESNRGLIILLWGTAWLQLAKGLIFINKI